MIDIAAYIGKLVRTHELVIIPGLGGFLTNFHPSSIHALSNRIEPPGRHIAFNSQLKDNDGFLAHALSKKLELNYKDALTLVEAFTQSCLDELEDGHNVSFENLGILSLNATGNITFSPDLSINYADDYFGLPDIIAPRIIRDRQYEPVIQLNPKAKESLKSNARLIRKIAAVAIPFIFLGLFAFFAKDSIKNMYQQSAAVFSFNTVDKASPNNGPAKVLEETEDKAAPEKVEEQTTSVDSASEPKAEIIYDEAPSTAKGSFHIICGAFSHKNLAVKLVQQLNTEGFSAYIAGQNNGGLYRVSSANFSIRGQAVAQLRWYQANRNKNAWLLEEDL
jgi:hypothetical protein